MPSRLWALASREGRLWHIHGEALRGNQLPEEYERRV